jgi:hypothetical protein
MESAALCWKERVGLSLGSGLALGTHARLEQWEMQQLTEVLLLGAHWEEGGRKEGDIGDDVCDLNTITICDDNFLSIESSLKQAARFKSIHTVEQDRPFQLSIDDSRPA